MFQFYGTVIAIDPGTEKSGVAIFVDGVLSQLEMMPLPQLVDLIKKTDADFVIEDVEANGFIYTRNQKTNKQAGLKVAQSVGLVKATARHIMSFMDWHHRQYTKIPPTTGNWGTVEPKYGSLALEQRLGWTGTSNKDTRSAAFFGYLYLRRLQQTKRTSA